MAVTTLWQEKKKSKNNIHSPGLLKVKI